jgi:hypothetical protein
MVVHGRTNRQKQTKQQKTTVKLHKYQNKQKNSPSQNFSESFYATCF